MKSFKKRIIAFALAISTLLGLSGCNVKHDGKEKKSHSSTSVSTNTSNENSLHTTVPTTHFSYSQDYTITESAEVTLSPTYDESFESGTVTIPEEPANDYILSIDSVKPYYSHYTYYPTSEEINSFLDSTGTVKSCDYVFDNDLEKLLDKLKSNSAKLDLEVDKYIYPFSDNNHFRSAEHLTDQEFFEAAFETVLSDLLSSSTNNSNEDICTLKDYGFALCYKKTEISEFFAAAATNVSEKKIIFFLSDASVQFSCSVVSDSLQPH